MTQSASEAQQGADTAEHVEVGIVAAHLEVHGLVQRLLHSFLRFLSEFV